MSDHQRAYAVDVVSTVAESMDEFLDSDRYPTDAILKLWVVVLSQAVCDLKKSEAAGR